MTNSVPFSKKLTDYILSGHALIAIRTSERLRCFKSIQSACRSISKAGEEWSVLAWSISTGVVPSGSFDIVKPEDMCNAMVSAADRTVLVAYDFNMYMDTARYSYGDVVVSSMTMRRPEMAAHKKCIILVGPVIDIPAELIDDVVVVEFDRPSAEEIAQQVKDLCVSVEKGKYLPDDDNLMRIGAACRGMTYDQVEDRTALALRRFKGDLSKSIPMLLEEKASIIRQTGILSYAEPPSGGLDRIGGWTNVKKHIRTDAVVLRDPIGAANYGVSPPRGLLLVGVPGAGKTAMSMAIASYLNMPLIVMDVGAIMSKWVGESEANMRTALAILDCIGNCVLQIDEIEKGFANVGGDSDSGAGTRVFGTFLKWLSDRQSPVYVVATANNISSLPPEFARKGRWDEIYGVFLPDEKEREDIIKIHLRLRGYDDVDDVGTMVKATNRYSGADIEEVVKRAVKHMWVAGVTNDRAAVSKYLLEAVGQVRPLSKTDPDSVVCIEKWLESHTQPAGEVSKSMIVSERSVHV